MLDVEKTSVELTGREQLGGLYSSKGRKQLGAMVIVGKVIMVQLWAYVVKVEPRGSGDQVAVRSKRKKRSRLTQVFGSRMSCHLLRWKCLGREQVWAAKIKKSLGVY